MSNPIDEQVWAGLERRLAAVEAYVGEPSPWRPADGRVSKVSVRILGGPVVGRPTPAHRHARSLPTVAVVLLIVAALVIGLVIVGLAGQRLPRPTLVQGFNPTGPMNRIRASVALVALPDGRALAIGGDVPLGGNFPSSSSADVYEPTTGKFTAAGELPAGVRMTGYSSATALLDGRVLVVDGYDATAAIFDPVSTTFAPVGRLSTPRSYAATAVLRDGRVLVVGGEASRPAGPALATALLFDPVTGQFTATGSMSTARGGPTATTLADGRVLVTSTEEDVLSCELYDPGSGRFTEGGSLGQPLNQYSVARLADGRALFVGGWTTSAAGADGLVDRAYLYDPANGAFTPAATLVTSRRLEQATTLLDGRVLITGGDRWPLSDTADLTSELFDPVTSRFSEVADSLVSIDATATRLLDGDVLIVDGTIGGESVANARIFHPGRP